MTRDAEHTPSTQSVVVPDPLWMMHVIGPDDVYPAPDHATAVQWCAYLNREIAPKVPEVLCVAVPAIWTGTPEEHAEGLAEAIKGWTVPAAPSSLAGGEVREAVARTEDRIGSRLMKAKDEAWNLVPQGQRAKWIEDNLASATVEVSYSDIRAILAALSPEAPARPVWMGIDAAGDAPQEFKDFAADFNRRQAALTPRHEAPASEDEVRRKLIQCIEQWDGETEYDADDLASLADSILHAFNGPPVVSPAAPVQLSSHPCQLEAQAEGAGEALKETISRMLWSFMTSSEEVDDLTDIGWTKAKQLIEQGFFTGTSAAYYSRIGGFADTLIATIRARSSAPDALGNLLAVIHGDGGHRTLEVGVEQAAAEAEKIVADLLSSAPEAREGEAVADAGRQAIWAVVHEVWQLLDDGETDSAGKTTVDQDRWQAVSDAMDKLEALVPDSEGPFWGGFPVNYFWPKAAEVFPASGNNHPAAPSADKLRELVGASEDILSALSVLTVAGKPIASLDTKLRDAINTLVPALSALKAEGA